MDHLLFYARFKGITGQMAFKIAKAAAESVRLGNALTKKSSELSGGMRRSLSLAIAAPFDHILTSKNEKESKGE